MITRYVLKGFRRHKMRTAIMIVALGFVATMLVVLNNTIATSRRQVVELVAREVGEHKAAQRTRRSPGHGTRRRAVASRNKPLSRSCTSATGRSLSSGR